MKKILVIQTASIGDVILATALIESLHNSFSEASIDFMVKKGNENLFKSHPFLNRVIIWDKRAAKYSGFLAITRQVRQTQYDLVVNIQRFFLTGLLTVLSGAMETRGFSKNPLSALFTRRFKHQLGSNLHEVDRNQALISDLTIPGKIVPKLYPSVEDEDVVSPYMSGKYYTVSPASLWFTKQYPVEKWIDLIRHIPGDAKIFLLGGPGDLALCSEIVRQSSHTGVKILAGQLTLLQSAALMRNAGMNFTNDSAPMHLASSVNAPVTAIYCSTVPQFGFGPLSSDSTVVETTEQLSCRPCGLHGYSACPEKHFRCAFDIKTEMLTRNLH
ncbi:MAG: glycosyltransferase family 9 protein [Bacteroidales bacterium]